MMARRSDDRRVVVRRVTATRVILDGGNVVPEGAFQNDPNIEEVICREDIEKIEAFAFYICPRLRLVVMPNVTVTEKDAFINCRALADVECDKLEIIGAGAFYRCESLKSINLPSVRIVEEFAFTCCNALTSAIFSDKLERIDELVFVKCTSLERITIPLKDGIIAHDCIFAACENLKHVDLVEGAALCETIAALHVEEWRNDMIDEIGRINRILPDTPPGHGNNLFLGGKAQTIRRWIEQVLRKINHYKAKHRRVMDESVSILQHALPQDIAMNNVLPFLELPSYTLGGED